MAIKPSAHLALFILLLHATAVVVVYATVMPQYVKPIIFILILLSLFCYLGRDALLLWPGSWREISLGRDSISVIARDGSTFTGQATGKTTLSPYFAVLHIRPDGCHWPVCRIIAPDAVGKEAFRELCVHMRLV